MSLTRTFLLELYLEDLPADSMEKVAHGFKSTWEEKLVQWGFRFESLVVFVTPRRLVVKVQALQIESTPPPVRKRGPAVAQAFDEAGRPTKALEGFLRSCGAHHPKELKEEKNEKGHWLYWEGQAPSVDFPSVANELLQGVLQQMVLPKKMRWGQSEIPFLRPVRKLVALWGHEVLALSAFQVTAGRKTVGRRFRYPLREGQAFEDSLEFVEVASADEYESLLGAHRILLDFQARKQWIQSNSLEGAKTKGGVPVCDEALWDEITGLTESPAIYLASFDPRFLDLPEAVLITCMHTHQKVIPIRSDSSAGGNSARLQPWFLIVANASPERPSALIRGYETVMQARLEDALFYYEQDLKADWKAWQEGLSRALFERRLGSLLDKQQRMAKMICRMGTLFDLPLVLLEQAALACKLDLMSLMVGEFPELQGLMGGHYLQAKGWDDAVARAVTEHYGPRHAMDRLPTSDLGALLAFVDKLDHLLGFFGVNQRPTGEKDPYALRRQALTALRLMLEHPLWTDYFRSNPEKGGLMPLLNNMVAFYPSGLLVPDTVENVNRFIQERARVWLQERYDVSALVVAAALPSYWVHWNPVQAVARALALEQYHGRPEWSVVLGLFKRIDHLIQKASLQEADPIIEDFEGAWDFALPVERKLLAASKRLESDTQLQASGRELAYLESLCALSEPLSDFFEQVMVLDEDRQKRHQRLALLRSIWEQFQYFADFRRLTH